VTTIKKLPAAPEPTTKKEQLIALLREKEGLDVGQLGAALGWLPHTVRAAVVGLRKTGLKIECTPSDTGKGGRYRIIAEARTSR
jgi:predicted ArsR family transcriptional regulator